MNETKIPLTDLSLPFGCGISCSNPCSSDTATSGTVNTIKKALEAEGWIARSSIDEPRLSEIAKTYENIGYEVKIIYSDTASLGNDCTICFDDLEANNRRWGTVYIRKARIPTDIATKTQLTAPTELTDNQEINPCD
ncbi:MAG: hypothetical protein AB7U63_08355 [Porticoccaceae bacterium]